MEKFNVFLSQTAVTNGRNDSGGSVHERRCNFHVDSESNGLSAGDAIESLALVLARQYGLEKSGDIQPPRYLPSEHQRAIPQASVQEPEKTNMGPKRWNNMKDFDDGALRKVKLCLD